MRSIFRRIVLLNPVAPLRREVTLKRSTQRRSNKFSLVIWVCLDMSHLVQRLPVLVKIRIHKGCNHVVWMNLVEQHSRIFWLVLLDQSVASEEVILAHTGQGLRHAHHSVSDFGCFLPVPLQLTDSSERLVQIQVDTILFHYVDVIEECADNILDPLPFAALWRQFENNPEFRTSRAGVCIG